MPRYACARLREEYPDGAVVTFAAGGQEEARLLAAMEAGAEKRGGTLDPNRRHQTYWNRRRHEPIVYFLEAHGGDGIKIGTTNCLKRRLMAINGGCPFPVRVLATIPAGRSTERALHERFASDRIRENAEWFRPSPALLSYIKTLGACAPANDHQEAALCPHRPKPRGARPMPQGAPSLTHAPRPKSPRGRAAARPS